MRASWQSGKLLVVWTDVEVIAKEPVVWRSQHCSRRLCEVDGLADLITSENSGRADWI